MRESLRALALTGTVVMLAWSGVARADVAPPDTCTTVGQACNNAGPSYDQPGVCVTSSCSHPTPDGSTSYPCSLCELADAAASSSSGGSSGSSSGAGSSSSGSSGGSSGGGSSGSSKSGCAMSPLARDGATGIAMLALGLGALALGRRRRQ